MKIRTKQFGELEVTTGEDLCGDFRIYPKGAATLEKWRQNRELIPPWLLPSECEDDEFKKMCAQHYLHMPRCDVLWILSHNSNRRG